MVLAAVVGSTQLYDSTSKAPERFCFDALQGRRIVGDQADYVRDLEQFLLLPRRYLQRQREAYGAHLALLAERNAALNGL